MKHIALLTDGKLVRIVCCIGARDERRVRARWLARDSRNSTREATPTEVAEWAL